MVYEMLPSMSGSSMPVTVTVCRPFQLAEVKVRPVRSGVPSEVSLVDTGMVTFCVGRELRRTVKVPVPAASVVLPLITLTVKPAVSLSTLVAATSGGFSVL
jgi:hypothetical protein